MSYLCTCNADYGSIHRWLDSLSRDERSNIKQEYTSLSWTIRETYNSSKVRTPHTYKTPYIKEYGSTYERVFSTVLTHMLNTPRRCCYKSSDYLNIDVVTSGGVCVVAKNRRMAQGQCDKRWGGKYRAVGVTVRSGIANGNT